MKRVLIIDDDQMNAMIIAHYLTSDGAYQTDWAADARTALSKLTRPYDAILLDIMLPDADGIALCAEIRRRIYCPILFISCIDDEDTVIRALQTGGDDYLIKPFSNKLLRAKVAANIRRVEMEKQQQGDPPPGAGFAIDRAAHALVVRGQRYHLSSIAFDILLFFVSHPRETFTPEQIYEAVWNAPSYGDVRTVISHIYSIRRRLEEDPHHPRYLRSLRGYGYYFDPEGREPEA